MILNDPEIREILKQYLKRLPVKPTAILDELHIHRGNAIADVVAVYNAPHCYEIKGDNDVISRIEKQGKYYDLAFNKITLVTTSKHEKNALKTAPSHWGILIIENLENKIRIKHLKKAKRNPFFDKNIAIQTLWRNEMLSIIEENNLDISLKLNKIDLASNLAKQLNIQTIHNSLAKKLIERTAFKIQNF